MRPDGTYILPILHAASFFRDQSLAFTGVADWQKAVRIQREGPTIIHPPFEEWQWRPTLKDVESYFNRYVFDLDRRLGPWSFDFEATLNRDVVCLGIWPCTNPTKEMGICLPFYSQGGVRYWTSDEEQVVRRICTQFFTNPLYLKIGQNANGYDCGVPPFNEHSLLKQAWDIDIQGFVGDTLTAHHLCFSELRHGLAFQSSIVTDLSPYKDELWDEEQEEDDDDAADWARILDLPDERVRKYCLKDCFATAVAWNVLVEEMS